MHFPEEEKPLDHQTTLLVPAVVPQPLVASTPTWPPPPRPRPPQGPPKWAKILAASLAVLLVFSGLGLLIYSTTDQFNQTLNAPRTHATATVRAALHATATGIRQAQQTAVPLQTANAQVFATATAQAGPAATATATLAQGTQTAQEMGALLTKATEGTPTLDDPLSDNSQGNTWDVGYTDNNDSGCNFVNSSYQVLEAIQTMIRPCFADATKFDNFAYQVSLTLHSNCSGGLILRGDKSTGQYYLFLVNANGSYSFEVYTSSQHLTLASGSSTAVLAVGQANTLAVVADQGVFDLFINQTYVAEAINGELSSGQVGVVVQNTSVPASANFSNARAWKI